MYLGRHLIKVKRNPSGVFTVRPGTLSIGGAAFFDCADFISEITIPESVEIIGTQAFSSCKKLSVISDCPTVTVVCKEESFIHHYCLNHNLTFIFDYQFEAFNGVIPPGIEKIASPFLADEGGPFVFVSYSHKDREGVLKNITALYESGWRIWYDEGLTIGDRYDVTLEEHIRNCSAFLLFVTENSLNSDYIKEYEIPWAEEFNKPIIKCILDNDVDYEITEGNVTATVSPDDVEQALLKIKDLSKGKCREAQGISVLFNPADRELKNGDGFAYCLYAEQSSARAKAILLEAKNNGCTIYDAIENGEDKEKQHNCESMIVFLDKAFLADQYLLEILAKEYESGRDIAVCQLDDVQEEDLPEKVRGLYCFHWLVFNTFSFTDNKKQLPRYLQKRGCVNTAILPGFEYDVTNNGIVITRYKGINSDPKIECEYGGIPVVKIAERAFQNCIRIRTIVIPDTVKEIEAFAFSGCTNLTSITISCSVKIITDGLFHRCTSLTTVILPHGLTRICNFAFEGCTMLTSIIIPNSVTFINHRAFKDCKGLIAITIPDSVTTIDMCAFEGCSSLTVVSLPKNITEIGYQVFNKCVSLNTITIPDSVIEIGFDAFGCCISLTEITFPKNITRIRSHAFKDCTGLTSITLPKTEIAIEDDAFNGCKKLANIVNPDSIKEIGSGAFHGCEALAESNGFVILRGVIYSYHGNEITVNIPENINVIGSRAFSYCKKLVSVTIPDSVTTIDSCAFMGCSSLTVVAIPNSITKIGYGVFYNCTGLTEIAIPESVVRIGKKAFRGCNSLTSIVLPDSVVSIGDEAFKECTNLILCEISNGVSKISFCLFDGCVNLASVIIPESVKKIESFAFRGCNELVIYGRLGSYAERYARENGVPFKEV